MIYKLQVLALTFLFSLFSTTIHARDYMNDNEEVVIGEITEELYAGTDTNQELEDPSNTASDENKIMPRSEQADPPATQSESEMSDSTKAILGCLALGPICLVVVYTLVLGCIHPGSNIC